MRESFRDIAGKFDRSPHEFSDFVLKITVFLEMLKTKSLKKDIWTSKRHI